MAETMTNALPDDIRDSLGQAFNSALVNAVPYVLAKDLRQDYPGVKFDALLETIKGFISADSDIKAATARGRTPCLIIHFFQHQEIDLRDYLHTNVNPYNWTEQDVHYPKLRACVRRFRSGYEERDTMLWYQAPGDRTGYADGIAGLKPLLRQLIQSTTTDDLIIQIQFQNKHSMEGYKNAMGTEELPPPNVIDE